jgi:hypothetical protein
MPVGSAPSDPKHRPGAHALLRAASNRYQPPSAGVVTGSVAGMSAVVSIDD